MTDEKLDEIASRISANQFLIEILLTNFLNGMDDQTQSKFMDDISKVAAKHNPKNPLQSKKIETHIQRILANSMERLGSS